MRISNTYGFIFISTPKACTHTIYKILETHYSPLRKYGFHTTKIPTAFRDLFRWTVCRNPYSRAVSLWWSACHLHPEDIYGFREKCGSSDNFLIFIEWLASTSKWERSQEPLMMSQSKWLEPVEPVNAVHLENLEGELKGLYFWQDGIELPRLNTTDQKLLDQGVSHKAPPWQSFYSDKRAIEAVHRWAGEDFKRFGYSHEIN